MSKQALQRFADDIQRISSFTLEEELAGTNVHYYIFAEKWIVSALKKNFPQAKESNITKIARAACKNPHISINKTGWGGNLFKIPQNSHKNLPTEIARHVSSNRGSICKLISSNFNFNSFQTAVNSWKIDEITNPLLKIENKSGNKSWQDRGKAFRKDLTRIHGTPGMHSTTRVGYATQGEKSTSLGARPSDVHDSDDMHEFVIPYYRHKLAENMQVEAGVEMAGTTDKTKVEDEVIIAIRMGDVSLQSEAASWDAQGRKLNKALKEVEDEIIGEIEEEYGKGSKEVKASPSAATRAKRMAVDLVVDKIKKKPALRGKVKTKVKEKKVKKGTRRVSAKSKSSKGSPAVVAGSVKLKGKGKTTKRTRREPSQNPIGLVALLNRSLPAQVQKNMAPIRGSSPRRLTYRTGRFAGSAEIINIAPYPNMVEIQYSYDKDPYAVFEQGSGDSRATGPARDPREIIGQSIREIAQQMMGTKFGIIRTKRV
jgi:hypothetical protein